ncbi:MAG: M23 family metallopeptidase [Spirochaetaceae bacterium]|nr:MAG: M23 family metallopeptidase [Spirochaetaceae bacterium]
MLAIHCFAMTSGWPRNRHFALIKAGIALLLLAINAGASEPLPEVGTLSDSDPLFSQIREDIERSFRNEEKTPALLLYRYRPKSNETLFSIASRLLLPYGTLATLNKIETATDGLGDNDEGYILIPNQPGLFSPELLPDLPKEEAQTVFLPVPHRDEGRWFFYPGRDFSPQARRDFFTHPFGFPVAAPRITSPYGMRVSPITGKQMMHHGVDFGGRPNTPVIAAADGRIIAVEWSPVLGFFVEIQHDNQLTSLYGHLSQITVSYGQRVSKAEQIGKMGTTGLTTGPHVHFEIRRNGVPVDPFTVLPRVSE